MTTFAGDPCLTLERPGVETGCTKTPPAVLTRGQTSRGSFRLPRGRLHREYFRAPEVDTHEALGAVVHHERERRRSLPRGGDPDRRSPRSEIGGMQIDEPRTQSPDIAGTIAIVV